VVNLLIMIKELTLRSIGPSFKKVVVDCDALLKKHYLTVSRSENLRRHHRDEIIVLSSNACVSLLMTCFISFEDLGISVDFAFSDTDNVFLKKMRSIMIERGYSVLVTKSPCALACAEMTIIKSHDAVFSPVCGSLKYGATALITRVPDPFSLIKLFVLETDSDENEISGI
jgi:hypothetical protein